MDIQIDRLGLIVSGHEAGKYIRIIDDADNTGGYLILTAATADMTEGFDSWCENQDALYSYFTESGWTVRWLSPQP
jgi:hypothetical protein